MGLFSQKPRTEGISDPAKLLVLDHEKVERLFDGIRAADSAAERQGLIAQLDTELSLHTRIEEEVLYPFIRANVPGGDEMMREAEQEHADAKAALARLVVLDGGDDEVLDAAAHLEKLVSHHVDEEEGTIFSRLQETTDPAILARLRADLENAKFGATPTHPLEVPAAAAPRKKAAAKRKAAAKKAPARRKAAAKRAPAKRKAAAKRAPAKKAAATRKRATAKRKAAAKKAPATRKRATATRKAAAKRAPAKKKAAAKRAPAKKKAAAKKAAATRRRATATRKTAAKKAAATRKRTTAKKAPARKKAPAKKAAARRRR